MLKIFNNFQKLNFKYHDHMNELINEAHYFFKLVNLDYLFLENLLNIYENQIFRNLDL